MTSKPVTEPEPEQLEEEEEKEEKAKPQNLVLGISMVGILILAMGMWYLVHAKDPDVRETGWSIISGTISIFVAVLIFTFTTRFFDTYVIEMLVAKAKSASTMDA